MKILKFWFTGILFTASIYVGFNLLYWLGLNNHELVFEIVKTYNSIKSEHIKNASIKISLESLNAGIMVAKYYTSSFKAIWGVNESKIIYANVVIDHWNSIEEVFTARDIYQKNWSSIGRDTEKTKIALDTLVEHGYIKKVNNSNPNGGRTTTRYKKIK